MWTANEACGRSRESTTIVEKPIMCLLSVTPSTSVNARLTVDRPLRSAGQKSRRFVSTSDLIDRPQSFAVLTTTSRSLSIEASTAAITAPSTKGALLRMTRPCPLASCSMAIWVLSTALPRSTRISTPSGPRTSSIAPRIAVASVPRRPSAVPPATAICTLPCVIWAASSRTPSASCRLCDTSTRLTVPIGPRQDVDGMCRTRSSSMLDLHAASLAVGQHRVAARGFDRLEEPAANLHGEVVFLHLDAVGPRNAAASLIDFLHAHPRDQAEQPHRRVADP